MTLSRIFPESVCLVNLWAVKFIFHDFPGSKDAIDNAFKALKNCLELQGNLYEEKKINSLEAKISDVENSIETFNFERKKIEATIKEILSNIRRQSVE